MKVTDPTGDTWRVRRRWLPWRPRRRDVEGGDPGAFGASSPDELVGLILVVVILVLLILAPWILAGAFLVVEVLVVVLLLPLFLLLRVSRLARWPVVVRQGRTLAWEESVRGWEASDHRIREIAEAIARGEVVAVRPDDDDLPRHRSM